MELLRVSLLNRSRHEIRKSMNHARAVKKKIDNDMALLINLINGGTNGCENQQNGFLRLAGHTL